MGGRKLRFNQRKNFERKKWKKKPQDSLIVSIPLRLLPEVEYAVSIPISIYLSAETFDLSLLWSRLRQSNVSDLGYSIHVRELLFTAFSDIREFKIHVYA